MEIWQPYTMHTSPADHHDILTWRQDLSVISIDNLLVSRYISPPLTTMTFDKELLGRRAVEILYAILTETEYEHVTLLPTTLCERSSVKNLTAKETTV